MKFESLQIPEEAATRGMNDSELHDTFGGDIPDFAGHVDPTPRDHKASKWFVKHATRAGPFASRSRWQKLSARKRKGDGVLRMQQKARMPKKTKKHPQTKKTPILD